MNEHAEKHGKNHNIKNNLTDMTAKEIKFMDRIMKKTKGIKEKVRFDFKERYPEYFKEWRKKDLSAQHRLFNSHKEIILYLDKYLSLSSTDEGKNWEFYEGKTNIPENANLGIFQFHNELIGLSGKKLTRSYTFARTWESPEEIPSAVDIHSSSIIGPNCFSAIMTSKKRIVLVSDYWVGQEGPDTQLLCSTISDDGGRTWQHSKLFGPSMPLPQGPEGFGEPAVVEMPSGWLWMVFRTLYGELWQSISPDRGLTWLPACPTGLASPIANCYAKRIPNSTGIVLVWNLTKPGISTDFRNQASLYQPRSNLVFSVSHDNCRTWTCPITIEEMSGLYPTIQFSENRMFIMYQSSSDNEVKNWHDYGLTFVAYDLEDIENLKPWTRETIQPFIDGGLVAHWLSLKALPQDILEVIN